MVKRLVHVQPQSCLFPAVDGPLLEKIQSLPNQSAWLYEAYERYYKAWGGVAPDDGPLYKLRTCLRVGPDDDLIAFWDRLKTRLRKYDLRNAAWFRFGQESGIGIDPDVLALEIVRNLREMGIGVIAPGQAADEDVAEVIKANLAQFLT